MRPCYVCSSSAFQSGSSAEATGKGVAAIVHLLKQRRSGQLAESAVSRAREIRSVIIAVYRLPLSGSYGVMPFRIDHPLDCDGALDALLTSAEGFLCSTYR